MLVGFHLLFPRKQSSKATGTWTTSNSTPNTVVSIGALTIERAVDGITYKNTNAITIEMQQYPTGGGLAAAVTMDAAASLMLTGHYEVA